MPNSIKIPMKAIRLIPASQELRQRHQYVDGKRTDSPALDEQGRPQYTVDGIIDCPSLGTIGGVRVTVATPDLPAVIFGQPLTLTDDAVITIRNQSNAFELGIAVEASGFLQNKA